jgi:hypothetical protein
MAKKVGDIDESKIKQIRADALGLVNDLDSIGKSINSSLETVSKLTGESVKSFKEQFSSANALGDAISKVDSKTLASKKQQASFQDKVRKATEEATKLETKAFRLRQESVNYTKKQAIEANKVARAYENGADKLKEQAKSAEKITDQFEKLNTQTRFFDGMADLTKDIPVISNVLKDFQKASDKAREAASEGGSAFKAGAKELANLGVKGLGALGIGFAVKGINDLSERTTSIARNLNLSKQEARDLDQEFINLSFSLGKGSFTAKELEQYTMGFAQSMGAVGKLAPELTEEIALQQKFLGLSADESAKFAKFTLATGQDAKKLGNDIRGRVVLSNALNKTSIDYKAITKDVANASASVKISTLGTGKNLAQAVIESKKLGLSLGQVDKIADSLLNFESSIAAELEAELLTGQDLNLEDARRLALNNDLAGLSKELTRQNITQEKFGKMNRIQQEAIAKSLGMSREDMSEMLLEQKALSAFGASNAKDLDTAVKKEYEQVKLLEKQGKFADAEVVRQKIINKLGSDEKITQLDNKSIAEMQALAAQKTVEAFGKLAPLLDIVEKVFGFINNHATAFAAILGTLGVVSIVRQFRGLLKIFQGLSGASKNIAKFLGIGAKSSEKVLTATMKNTGKTISGAAAQSAVKAGSAIATKTAAKAGSKLAGKTLLKRIPILGSIVGLGFAVDRAMKGDLTGAALEAGSAGLGLLDLVAPGLGTGLSLAADAGIAARDFKRAGTITPTAKPMATGGIVTGPTRALVGEAGAEAVIPLNKFYASLDKQTELLSIISRKSNDLVVDGDRLRNNIGMGFAIG